MNTKLTKTLIPLCCLGVLACGGGGGGDSGDSDQRPGNSLADQPYGEIVFANQGNKLSATAWFFDGHSSDHAQTPTASLIWQADGEHCEAALHSDDRFSAQLGSYWRDAYSAGDAIRVDSQSGNYATLNTQTLGNTVSYATDVRWIREPMPDDAILSVAGSDRFPSVSAIPLTPLPLLNSVSPDDGIITNGSRTIGWENNSVGSSTIKITFSSTSTENDGMHWVNCEVVDDGSFDVPQEVLNHLNAAALDVNFSMRRISERVIEVDNAVLTVLQLDYPL